MISLVVVVVSAVARAGDQNMTNATTNPVVGTKDSRSPRNRVWRCDVG